MRSRRATFAQLDQGLRLFTLGLGLKVLLANQIGNFWSDIQAIGYESISTPVAGWEFLPIAFSFILTFTDIL